MNYLPVNLRLDDRLVLLVGGGPEALQKADVLARNGARVRVVDPAPLAAMAQYEGFEIVRRDFIDSDLDDAHYVIVCTDNAELNHAIHAKGKARGLLVNVVDDPEYCDFIFPSILRRGPLAVAVSTSGMGPALARMLRQRLERDFAPDYGDVLRELNRLRAEARRRMACPGARRATSEALSYLAFAGRADVDAGLVERMRALVEEVAAFEPGTTGGKKLPAD